MRLNLKSIGGRLWLYFVVFAAILLLILWLMQTVFLQSFYEQMKARDVARVAGEIMAGYGEEDFAEKTDSLTFRHSLQVLIAGESGQVEFFSDEYGGSRFSFVNIPGELLIAVRDNIPGGLLIAVRDYDNFLSRLSAAGSGHISYILDDERVDGRSLVYGAVMAGGRTLYISTPLMPLNATTSILIEQLIYVTAFALCLSVVIAFFISRKFSRPIAAISAEAGKLARGDFGVSFRGGSYTEINELAVTLDHTATELSKIENLRRELIANISHDLRTPLTLVKAYAEMIRDISGEDRERRGQHLSVITDEADRLTALVNNILQLSQIQSGNMSIKSERFDLSALVMWVKQHFEPLFSLSNLDLYDDVEPGIMVLGDEQRITQALYNLLGNAKTHAGEGRAVRIELKSEDLNTARLSVSDGGNGIPEEDLPYIWDRYYRARNAGGAEGAGLGLSIVKGILESHNASYGAYNADTGGGVFWFTLKKDIS